MDPEDAYFSNQTDSVDQQVANAAKQYIELFNTRVSNFNADAAIIKVCSDGDMYHMIWF